MICRLNPFSQSVPRGGFTLIEILATLAIMSVFTTFAITGMSTVVDDAKFNQTQREMEQIRAALVGETQRLESGLRRNYGYLGDVGVLPTSAQGLAVLSSLPAGVTSWTLNSSYGIGSGWRGPYLSNTADQNFFQDGWGRNYVYNNPAGGPATLTSLGSDGSSGGSGYAADLVVSIPNTVSFGNFYGYVVRSQGDVIGADQVPFSASAQAFIYYPNGSGGFSSKSYNISAVHVGRYSFSSVPLGYAALKVFIPTSASPTDTLGPSIVEINKAATAALPIAQETSTVYGNTSACTNGTTNFTVVPNTYVKDDTARTIAFQVMWPANFNWGGAGVFYTEQENAVSMTGFTVTNMATTASQEYRSSGGLIRPYPGGAGYTGWATNTSAALSTIAFTANVSYKLTFSYSATGWNSSQAIYYYRIDCKFLRAHPGMGL